MPITLSVTRGTTFTASSRVTASMLNAAALPTVSIGDGTLTAELLDETSFVAAFGDAFRAINWLPWGSLYPESFLATTVSCPAGQLTENHRQWWVQPTGAAVDSVKSARSSTNTALEAGRTALQVKGAASLTAVRVGTYLPPGLAGQLYGGNVAFSVYIWNSTGASITPSLEVSSSNSSGDEGAVTLRSTVAGSACANGAWTRVTFAIDATAITNWSNGVRLGLVFTVAANQLDVSTDYVLIADAQIDKGVTTATTFAGVPPPAQGIPAGTIFPYGGSTAPPGWLLCDGTAVSRTTYARLYGAIGTAYGTGDGSTTFNVPDMRGRTFAGAEVAGSSQSRLEISMNATGSSGDTVLTVASTANLRHGMGAYGTGIASGAYITDLTGTTAKLSAALTANVSGTVRFGKLGASADPESVGSAGAGLVTGQRRISLTQKGCSTATSTTLTVKTLRGLACGMLIDCTGVPAGTTIAAFLTATTLRMSAAATATASGLTATFRVDAPDSEQESAYQHLLRNPTVMCKFSGAADQNLQTGTAGTEDINWLIQPGWTVTGEASAGIVAGTYVSTTDTSGLDDFSLSVAATNAGAGTYELTFSGGSLVQTGQVATGAGLTLGNYIIKI